MACHLCLYDQTLKDEWGCDRPTQIAVWVDDEENKYFNCPLLFIPENVQEWLEEYSYQKEFGGAPSYRNQSKKFIEAIRIYENFLYTYKKQEPGSSSREQDLSVLMAKRKIEDGTK